MRAAIALIALLSPACLARADVAGDRGDRAAERNKMVEEQIAGRGVKNARVLRAMREVPRHGFVPVDQAARAYRDSPLPIGFEQTISQPYIVAAMTELLDPQPSHKVLEIGTGSGYQAAILSRLVDKVFSIEIVEELAARAKRDLEKHGFKNVVVIAGDGYRGLPAEAPFDGIIVTAAPDHVPQPLIDQLRAGGRMVIPVGDEYQQLKLFEKTKSGLVEKTIFDVRFVPMTGEARKKE
jgi:protein-L-isoaspartate(D-aspartate) O-methyltransferase